ncbi:SNARE-like superfamily protein [Perilla frutescens var. hirtella]|nr:SNARE-like superfamily protein [Perilla frutescens var. hirtella]
MTMVKITALMILKCTPEGADLVILVNASDLSSFGFFQRPSVKEFIIFVGRTVAKRTPPNQRQSVQHEASSPLNRPRYTVDDPSSLWDSANEFTTSIFDSLLGVPPVTFATCSNASSALFFCRNL